MRDPIRVTTLCLTLLSLLAAVPLAAIPSATHTAAALTEADQDSAWSSAWLHEILSWLDAVFASTGPEAAPAQLNYTPPPNTGEPVIPDPGFGISPQAGWDNDPNG